MSHGHPCGELWIPIPTPHDLRGGGGAGQGGCLGAYRFDGERVLNRDKFVAVK